MGIGFDAVHGVQKAIRGEVYVHLALRVAGVTIFGRWWAEPFSAVPAHGGVLRFDYAFSQEVFRDDLRPPFDSWFYCGRDRKWWLDRFLKIQRGSFNRMGGAALADFEFGYTFLFGLGLSPPPRSAASSLCWSDCVSVPGCGSPFHHS